MNTLGLDIGGANIKAVHTAGVCRSQAFALWKEPDKLTEQLALLAGQMPRFDRVALTMTAELCDCFATKHEGVEHVLDAAITVAGNRPVNVWLTEGRFGDVVEARRRPLSCAASNWHALATWLAPRHQSGSTLLIDTGSTTTDIIPLCDGRVRARGLTDMQRLSTGELIYVGARRTPLMALGSMIEFNGVGYALMAEWFATTADAFVLTGELPEQPQDTDTADSRPLTKMHAAARVARTIGADLRMLSLEGVTQLAAAFSSLARRRIVDGIVRATQERPPQRAIICGSGDFLACASAKAAWPGVPRECLSRQLSPEISSAACAYALVQMRDAQ